MRYCAGTQDADPGVDLSVIADMDSGDTAQVELTVSGGSLDVDVFGSSIKYTTFSGCLIL